MGKILRILFILAFLCKFFTISGQDVVYDTSMGNKSNTMQIKGGKFETPFKLYFENIGILTKSKIVVGAGILDGLTRGVDYVMEGVKYDTVYFEFKTDVPLNVITYKYYYNDTVYHSFLGIRKAPYGSDVFDGQYLFIAPFFQGNQVIDIYDGVGNNRIHQFTTKIGELTEDSYRQFQLSNQVTFRSIYGSDSLRVAKTDNIITDIHEIEYNVTLSPNPASDELKIKMSNNNGRRFKIRIYSIIVTLMNEDYMETSEKTINVSHLEDGMYFLLIFDENENMISKNKFIRIDN